MGYYVNFLDNELVTGAFLNDTAAELGGGVLAFQDDMTYGVDDLNGISAALVTKGVSRGCDLSVSGSQVTIGEGVLFMSDGRRVAIDAEGVTLDYTAGGVHYVWFGYDAVTGFVAPRCTVEEPAADDYVILGQITAEGTIDGKPDRAVMKNPFLGLHGTETFTKSFFWDGTEEEKLLWEFEPEDSGYQHVIVYSEGAGIYNAFCGFVNLSDGTAFSTLCNHLYASDDGSRGYKYASTNGEVLVSHSVNTRHSNTYRIVYLRFSLDSDKILRVYQCSRGAIGAGYNNTPATQITITLC